jgi:hypothetical protein
MPAFLKVAQNFRGWGVVVGFGVARVDFFVFVLVDATGLQNAQLHHQQQQLLPSVGLGYFLEKA